MLRAKPRSNSFVILLIRSGGLLLALLLEIGQALAFDALELRERLDDNPYTAARNAQFVATEARQRGDPALQLEALTVMAMAYNLIGDSSRATAPLEEATSLADRLKQRSALALLHGVRGEMLAADNQPKTAVRAFETALSEARSAKDTDAEAIVQSQYGAMLVGPLSLHAQAAPHLEAALNHFTKIDARARQAEVISSFASLFERLHLNAQAMSERRRALALISPERQAYLASSIYFDLGSSAFASEDNAAAEAALKRSIELSRSIADEFGLAYAQSALANVYIKSERWREALALLRNARPILLRGQNAVSIARIDIRTAVCLAKLGNTAAWASLAAAKPVLTSHDNLLFGKL